MSIITTDYGLIKPPPGCQIDYGHPINRGLFGYWLFNEKSGRRLNDYSGNGNHGTLTNFALSGATSNWVGSPTGGALNFDGSDDYTYSPIISVINGNQSHCAWVNIASSTALQFITTTENGLPPAAIYDRSLIMGRTTAHKVDLYITNAAGSIGYTVTSLSDIDTGKWVFICGVIRNDVGYIYINGVLENSAAVGTGYAGYTTPRYIFGLGKTTVNKPLLGSIDRVIIYRRALTQTEISQLYSQPNIGLLTPTYCTPS